MMNKHEFHSSCIDFVFFGNFFFYKKNDAIHWSKKNYKPKYSTGYPKDGATFNNKKIV